MFYDILHILLILCDSIHEPLVAKLPWRVALFHGSSGPMSVMALHPGALLQCGQPTWSTNLQPPTGLGQSLPTIRQHDEQTDEVYQL